MQPTLPDTPSPTDSAVLRDNLTGSRRSSLNSYKHGLTGKALLLTDTELPFYQAHCQGYVDHYQPVGQPEKALVQALADATWRALRAPAIEEAQIRVVYPVKSGSPVPALKPDSEKALANLALYLNRIERSIINYTKSLDLLQSQRRKKEQEKEEKEEEARRATEQSLQPSDLHHAIGQAMKSVSGPTPYHYWSAVRDYLATQNFVFSDSQWTRILKQLPAAHTARLRPSSPPAAAQNAPKAA